MIKHCLNSSKTEILQVTIWKQKELLDNPSIFLTGIYLYKNVYPPERTSISFIKYLCVIKFTCTFPSYPLKLLFNIRKQVL